MNYDKWKPDEDHIEWWEQKPACIGEAADESVFKHMLAGGLGRRGYASLPGALQAAGDSLSRLWGSGNQAGA
jgi:hypothetical protein